MSDNYLRLIPTDPTWRPRAEAAHRAAAALSALAPCADTVEAELSDEVRFIDQGGNFERVSCPECHSELGIEWWSEQMGHAVVGAFANLDVTTPCCGTPTNLNDLTYDWPAGFARTQLSARNPGRSWLDDAELARVAAALGHPLRQVMAHY